MPFIVQPGALDSFYVYKHGGSKPIAVCYTKSEADRVANALDVCEVSIPNAPYSVEDLSAIRSALASTGQIEIMSRLFPAPKISMLKGVRLYMQKIFGVSVSLKDAKTFVDSITS